jgi:hypothetical protein
VGKEMRVPTDYTCPFCHADRPLDDMSVANDTTRCRACGQALTFPLTGGTTTVSQDSRDIPPRHVRVEKSFNDETTITFRRLSPSLLFLIPFTAIWSGVTLWGSFAQQIRNGQFDLVQTLNGLPFIAGTVIMLGYIACVAFGKWVVKLNQGKGEVFVGVGRFGWKRHFSYQNTSVVCFVATGTKHWGKRQNGILVRTRENDFVFGTLIKDDVRRFIAATILQQARRLQASCHYAGV